MRRRNFISAAGLTLSTFANRGLGSSLCFPTTFQSPAFEPPTPYSNTTDPATFLYGTYDLWTSLPVSGAWTNLPHNNEGYCQKLFFWRRGYDWRADSHPNLILTGKRIDADAPTIAFSNASPAFTKTNTPAIVTTVIVPLLGCWEFSAYYVGHTLTFIVSVA